MMPATTLRRIFGGTNLAVDCATEEPFCLPIQVRRGEDGPPETEGYSLRLRVRNRSRLFAYRQVAVTATKIFREAEDGGFHTVPGFDPVELTWSESFGLFRDLPPGAEHFCFIGRIMKPDRAAFLGRRPAAADGRYTYLSLAAEAGRSESPHIVPPGRYRLYCTLSGPDLKPRAFTLRLFISGDWHDEARRMLGEGFRIDALDEAGSAEAGGG